MTRRLSAIRLAVASAVLCGVAGQARADFRLDVFAGFGKLGRPGAWTPALVDISGDGKGGAGKLYIRTSVGGRKYTQSYPIQVRGSGKQTLRVLFPFDPNETAPEVDASLEVDSRTVATKNVHALVAVDPSQPLFVALTQDRGGFGHLMRYNMQFAPLSRTPRESSWYRSAPPSQLAGSETHNKVVFPLPVEMPEVRLGYDAADAVILGDVPVESLTDAQWSALVGWIRAGGVLVISGGGDINRLRSPRLNDLLPINPTGVRPAQNLTSLSERYGEAGAPKGLPVIEGTLRSSSISICAQGSLPLLSLRRYGMGAVVFSGMDLAAPEVRDWAGGRAMWADFIARAQPEQSMGAGLREVAISPMQSGTLGQLADALGGQQSTQAPGSAQIGFFLVGYIACLAPLNYLILKRKDRREWAWLTAPVIVLLFSGGAYAVGKSVKGSQLFLSYITVVDATEGKEENPAVTIAAIFSPSQSRYNLHVDDPTAQGSDLSNSYGQFLSGSSSPDILVSHADGTTIRDSLVAMWDNRLFSFRGNAKISGPIHTSVSSTGSNQVRVTVTNNGKHRLTGCGIVMGGSLENMPDLEPGASATKEIVLNMGAGYLRLPSPSNGSRESVIAQAAAQALNSTGTQDQAVEPLMFVGWSSENAAGVTLQGERPTLSGATMIAAHLTLPPGLATLQANQRRAMYDQTLQRMSSQPSFNSGGSGMSAVAQAASLNNQAYTYANAGQLDAALKTAKAALALTPQDGNIADTVAEMYQKRRDFKQAEAFYVKALALQGGSGSAETHFKYAQTLVELGKKTPAIDQFRRAMSDPSYINRVNAELAKLGVSSPNTSSVAGPPGTVSTTQIGTADHGARRTVRILQDGRQEVRIESWRMMAGSRSTQESIQVLGANSPLPPLVLP